MKRVLRSRRLWAILLVLCLAACVTINIYFPAEKVESVATEIVNDIRGSRPAEKPPGGGAPQGSIFDVGRLPALSSVAWAQEAVDVSNPAIRALKSQMKQRYELLKPFYSNGSLVEKDDGYVAEGNADPLALKERRTLKGLIEAENRDRSQLYREVAAALAIDPGQTGRVGEIFAAEWKKSLP